MKKVFTVASEFDYRDTLHGDESQVWDEDKALTEAIKIALSSEGLKKFGRDYSARLSRKLTSDQTAGFPLPFT